MGDEPSNLSLGDGQTPYERSSRAGISEDEYNRLQDEYIDRLHALKEAFEKNATEAAECYMREQKTEHIAFYGDDLVGVYDQGHNLDRSRWDVGDALAQVVKRTIREPDILEYVSYITGSYGRHTSIRPDGFVYVLEAGPYYKIGRTSNLTIQIKTLKIQLPFPVRCIAAFPCEETSRAEAELHKRFEKHRANSEWFTLSDGNLWIYGLNWLKDIRYATTEHLPYPHGTQVEFHEEVPLAVQNDKAWREAFAAASDAVEVGE